MLTSTPPKPHSNLVPTSALRRQPRNPAHKLQFSKNLVNSQTLPTDPNSVAARLSINTTRPEKSNIYLNPFLANVFAKIEQLSEDRSGMIDLVNKIDGFVQNPSTFTLQEKQDKLYFNCTGIKQFNAINDLVKSILTNPSEWKQDLMMQKIDSRYPASNWSTGGTRRKRSKSRRKRTTYVRRKPTSAKALE